MADTLTVVAESVPKETEQSEPCTLAGLQSRLASLQADHSEVTEQIQSFRRRLRDGQLRACDTRTALDPAEIKYCQSNIASLHTRLTEIQAAIGDVGKALRAARTASPAASRVLNGRKMIMGRDGESHLVPRRNTQHHSFLVLECFLRLCEEQLSGEEFGRLLSDAVSLAKDIQKVGLDRD